MYQHIDILCYLTGQQFTHKTVRDVPRTEVHFEWGGCFFKKIAGKNPKNIGQPVRIFYHDYNKILHARNININTDKTSQQSFMSCTVYSKFAHNIGFKKRPLFMWSVYVIFFNWQYGSRPRKVFSLFRKRRDHYRWTTRKVICSSQPVCIGKSHYNYIISQTRIIILFNNFARNKQSQ